MTWNHKKDSVISLLVRRPGKKVPTSLAAQALLQKQMETEPMQIECALMQPNNPILVNDMEKAAEETGSCGPQVLMVGWLAGMLESVDVFGYWGLCQASSQVKDRGRKKTEKKQKKNRNQIRKKSEKKQKKIRKKTEKSRVF